MFRGLGTLLQIATGPARLERDDASSFFGVSVRVGRRPVTVTPPERPVRPPARRQVVREEGREPLADVFDEGEYFMVVVQVPGVEPSALTWAIRDERAVVIRTAAGGGVRAREIGLASRVDPATVTARHENGILELRLWKRP